MAKSKTKKESAAEWIPIGDLTPWAENPRKNEAAVSHVAESIERFGFASPIIARAGGEVIAGHTRLLAAQQLGLDRVPVRYMDLDPVDAKLLALADNKVAEIADWDDEGLERILSELKADGVDLDGLGWSDDELADILKEETEGLTDEDQVPEPPEEPVTVEGDLWLLGDHRLLCGDSTRLEVVERLMDGQKADMVFTDPPYGMNLDTDYSKMPSGKKHRQIIGDNQQFDPKFLLSIFVDCKEIFLWGADYYVENLGRSYPDLGSWIIWDKYSDAERMGLLDGKFGSVFETCWSKTRHKRELARVLVKTNYTSKGDETRVHPTQKPVELVEWFFSRWGAVDDIVTDLYLGSGSTLIACEKVKRSCRGLELDGGYCDVIINRWQDFTGSKATLESTGQTYDELKEERLASD